MDYTNAGELWSARRDVIINNLADHKKPAGYRSGVVAGEITREGGVPPKHTPATEGGKRGSVGHVRARKAGIS